jgi:hypothetical protein
LRMLDAKALIAETVYRQYDIVVQGTSKRPAKSWPRTTTSRRRNCGG